MAEIVRIHGIAYVAGEPDRKGNIVLRPQFAPGYYMTSNNAKSLTGLLIQLTESGQWHIWGDRWVDEPQAAIDRRVANWIDMHGLTRVYLTTTPPATVG